MKNAQIKSPLPALSGLVRKIRPYVGVMVFLLIASVYGFVLIKISELSDPKVDTTEVLAGAKAAPIAQIDDASAKQLLQLKDNSVNVQTLFEQNRTNPFDE